MKAFVLAGVVAFVSGIAIGRVLAPSTNRPVVLYSPPVDHNYTIEHVGHLGESVLRLPTIVIAAPRLRARAVYVRDSSELHAQSRLSGWTQRVL